MIPNGKYWTRDSLAMSQGLRLAPHQAVLSLPLWAAAVNRNLDRLEKSTRDPEDLLQKWPVSKRVNNSKAPGDDPALIDRVAA